MALAKRIIPCLDVNQGRVVKGVNFIDIKDAGDPVSIAKKYYQQGADELIFLDITASYENRSTFIDIIEKIADEIFIPFTVGGGINKIEDIRLLLNAGADKVSINSAAVYQKDFIYKLSDKFGKQCIVLAIDCKKHNDSWYVYTHGGRKNTGIDAIQWAKKMTTNGAGEILLTSMDRDGTKKGFDLEILRRVNEVVNVPVIASGGAGSMLDILRAITIGKADAVLAASIFHFNELTVPQVKQYLQDNNVLVRLT